MKSSKNVWMSERKTHALISDIVLLFLHFLIKEEVIKVYLKKQSFYFTETVSKLDSHLPNGLILFILLKAL